MRSNARYLALLVTLLMAGCLERHRSGREGTCDCCGTEVARDARESCSSGICDPFCIRFDAGPRALTCECCGTTVETTTDRPCELGVCDPYCLRPPPPPACPAMPIDLICGYSHISAGVPTALPVYVGGTDRCSCGETVTCRVDWASDFTIELSTGLCTDGALCGGCFAFDEGTCELPGLEEGRWTVNVNGRPSFLLDVAPAGTRPEPGSICLSAAQDFEGCGVLWPPAVYEPSSVCHPERVLLGNHIPIEVTDECGGCGATSGTCRVSIFDDVIRVTPSALLADCSVDCPAVCISRTDRCFAPPLAPGIWRVLAGGLESTLVVGEVPPAGPDICTRAP